MSDVLLLGIDVGTSATKAVVCDDAGVVVSSASAEHPISRPRPGWSEQRPEDWWDSTVRAARAALAMAADKPGGARAGAQVRGIGLSGQMHGLVLLDTEAVKGDGSVAAALHSALLWNDQRTGAECEEIERIAGGRAALVEMVGNAALTGFTLPKLLWMRRHEPEVYARAAMMLLPKDYVRLRMTGIAATDVGDASGTLLFDVGARAWSERAAAMFGVDPAMLPPVHESAAPAGRLMPWAARELGLEEGIIVAAGSGDNQAGAIGAGVVKPGMVLATLGTSGVVYAHTDRPRKDVGEGGGGAGRLHTMCAADGDDRRKGVGGAWSVTGCMLSAGGSLQWVRDTLFPSAGYDELMAEAAGAPPGSGGLVFLPYLTGERCPYPDPSARGGWVGLTARHDRGRLIRSVMEGVSFGMAQILGLVRGLGVSVEVARVGGGGAKSVLWRRMLADVMGCRVAMTNTEEGPAFGAALLGGVACGVFPNVEEACSRAIVQTETIEPGPEAAAYAPVREVYDRLYGDLRPSFALLSCVDR